MPNSPAEEIAIETLKILVVDDTRTNVLMLRTMLGKYGHQIVTAHDGLEAIAAYLRAAPDLILMDVMMPNMDGIEAARHIRDLDSIIPIIFLSASGDEKLIEQGLQVGTDYITKPVNLPQLNHKLNAQFRTVLAYREAIAKKKEVQQLHDRLLEENTVAAYVLSRMLSRMLPPSDAVQYTVIPSGMFSGDIVLAGTTPSGRLNVMLADAIGHGLPAAFSLMPVVPAFDAMTRKGFPLEDILFEINKTLRNVMPSGRFIAATAVSVDFKTGLCELWVGGNPGIAIISNHVVRHVPPSHLALGLIDHEDKAEFVCESVQLARDDRLVFSSDGLIEAWDNEIKATAGDFDAFIARCEPAAVFDRVREAAARHRRHDDTSLVVLHMGQAPSVDLLPTAQVGKRKFSRIELALDVAQLKSPDIAHTIVDMAHKMGVVAADDGLFGFVFAELFANALEHGVLGLPSEIKYASADGMENFLCLREESLAVLEHGHITVQIEATEFSGRAATLLRIIDSGPGFDQAVLLDDGEFAQNAAAGRGFKLVMNTCLKISYAGAGNDVTAYIPRQS